RHARQPGGSSFPAAIFSAAERRVARGKRSPRNIARWERVSARDLFVRRRCYVRTRRSYVEARPRRRIRGAILTPCSNPWSTSMRAADVRVLPALEPGESYVDPNFLLVETT